MPRVKCSVATRARRKKILKAMSGAKGARSRLFKTAKETWRRAWRYAYRDRRVRKREFRALWIQRIQAGVRAEGMTYSTFIHGLNVAGVQLDRKVLAELANADPAGFSAVVAKARAAISPGA